MRKQFLSAIILEGGRIVFLPLFGLPWTALVICLLKLSSLSALLFFEKREKKPEKQWGMVSFILSVVVVFILLSARVENFIFSLPQK
jgi:tryptophan-rich sensory protein